MEEGNRVGEEEGEEGSAASIGRGIRGEPTRVARQEDRGEGGEGGGRASVRASKPAKERAIMCIKIQLPLTTHGGGGTSCPDEDVDMVGTGG